MKVAILGTWHVHTKEYTTGVLNNPNAEVAVVWDSDAERRCPTVSGYVSLWLRIYSALPGFFQVAWRMTLPYPHRPDRPTGHPLSACLVLICQEGPICIRGPDGR